MRIQTEQKLAGILVPTFALRGSIDFGSGDTIAMQNAVDFCAANEIGVLQILPINETGGDNSPYNAISSVALDPLYIALTPELVPGLSQDLLNWLAPNSVREDLSRGAVNYKLVKQLKHDILRQSYNTFDREHWQANSSLAEDLRAFAVRHRRWLEPFTLFRTLMGEKNGDSRWTEWESELQSYESAREYVSKLPNAAAIDETRSFWRYVQWIAFRQWADLKRYAEQRSIQLMGDMPFGVSRYSADVWSEKHLFDLGWSSGAPPEKFFQGDRFTREWGQNWGMPLYNWDAHRKENFAWWRQRVHHLTEFFHYFRIDHVLGFFRVYAFPWIPERNHEFADLSQEEAAEITGGELPQFLPRSDDEPEDAKQNGIEGEALLRVLIEAGGETGIVAEDLGMVPDYVRPILKKLGIPGFSIPIFERIEEDRSFKPKELLPKLALSTYGTHDHQPIATYYDDLVKWWHGPGGHEGWLEIQRLMRFLELDEEPPSAFTPELHLQFLRILLETPCWLAVFMITDLLGTRQRFNEPGSASNDDNWSQRLDRPLDQYTSDPQYAETIRRFVELIKETKRVRPVYSRSN